MPELPEVAALRTILAEKLVGRVITSVQLVDFAALKTYAPSPDALIGLEIADVVRRGKFLALDAQGVFLMFHLARAGWVKWRDELPDAPARPGRGPLSLRVAVDDGSGFEITEAGKQRNVAVYVVTDLEQVPGIASLGPDPLADDFTPAVMDGLLAAAGRSQLKGVLRDQRTIAGIGNAYSDEILHAARLSPFKASDSLSDAERAVLFESIKSVLGDALERTAGLGADQLKDGKRTAFRVHDRTGQPCPVCGTKIAEVSFADRSLQYCPTCQTGGKPLADRRLSRLLK